MKKVINFYKRQISKLSGYDEKEFYAKFPDRIVYDADVARYARKHLRLIDFLDFRKVATAIIWSFIILQADKNEDFSDIMNRNQKFKF